MKKNINQRDSFYHEPTPKRVAPRMGNVQKNRGNKAIRKPKRGSR